MKKRFLAVFLALALCLGLAPTTAFADGSKYYDMVYPVVGGELHFKSYAGTIVSCDASITVADIPSSIGGIPVISIGYGAFYGCTNLTNVTIPDSVTEIDDKAFQNCTNLTSVTIFNGVTRIGGKAFEGCTNLTSVTIPASVTSIEERAFEGTPWLEGQGEFPIGNGILLKYQGDGGSVTIPDGVTGIGDHAFSGCTSLTSVTIPTSVTSIEWYAFYDCTNLTSVTIPTSVTYIGSYAFGGTPWLKGQGEFPIVNGILLRYQGNGGSVVIPSGVTSIGDDAFCYRTNLTSVTIPDSVTEIGKNAFYECDSLTSVTIPTSVTYIGGYAFYSCGNLTSVTIPTSVTSIRNSAFRGCGSLTDVYYGGTEAQWKGIDIDYSQEGNSRLLRTTIHYNAVGGPVGGFRDVTSGDWFADPVSWALEQGITTGKTATTFAPNENCTHAQILTFLWRAAGEPESSVTLPFSTTSNEYYLGAAKWAYEKGMIGADFNPGAACTRAYAVLYIWQAFGQPAPSKASPFTDVPAHWSSASAAAWAAEKGITTGTTATTFNPSGSCTRGQIVTFLYRAYK